MRPDAKFYEQSTKKVMMNGPRPSPLMISKDSHLIRKPSVYSTSNVVEDTKPLKKQQQQQPQQRQPIIIYTHSPKIIHTKPQDFMALVQRLTGRSPSSSKEDAAIATTSSSQPHYQTQNHEASENFGSSSMSDVSNTSSMQQRKKSGGSDVDETSSALRRDGGDDEACVQVSASVQLSPFGMGFADMPLFTPNSSDFFYSSRPAVVFKDSDSPFGILGSLISPSGLEFIKELPEY